MWASTTGAAPWSPKPTSDAGSTGPAAMALARTGSRAATAHATRFRMGVSSALPELELSRSLRAYRQVRRLDPVLASGEGLPAGRDQACRQERPFDRVGRPVTPSPPARRLRFRCPAGFAPRRYQRGTLR